MQFSNARLLSSDGSGHLNELNLNNSVSVLTLRVKQLKACSRARSQKSGSSLVFSTLTLVRAILLQAGNAPVIGHPLRGGGGVELNEHFTLQVGEVREVWFP